MFVASQVNAASLAPALMAGSELAPFAGFPLGSVLIAAVTGRHDATPRQVFRTNTMPPLFVWLVTRLLETDAKATNCPVVLVEGPEVVSVSPCVQFWHLDTRSQIPRSPWKPSGARSPAPAV